MTTHLDTATAYLAHLLLRDTRPAAHAKAKEPNAFARDKMTHFTYKRENDIPVLL
jgi:hypothetical protein